MHVNGVIAATGMRSLRHVTRFNAFRVDRLTFDDRRLLLRSVIVSTSQLLISLLSQHFTCLVQHQATVRPSASHFKATRDISRPLQRLTTQKTSFAQGLDSTCASVRAARRTRTSRDGPAGTGRVQAWRAG
jgi:hypothetical protein